MAVTLGGSVRRRRHGGSRGRSGDEDGRPGWLRVLGWTVGLGVVAYAAGYLVATRVLFPAPGPPADLLKVPDLQGDALAQAGDRLSALGLTLGEVDSLHHPSVDSGRVVGQAPLPGQLARPDAPVRVTVSLGPERRPVPDVARLRGDRALMVLEASGFDVAVDSVEDEAPKGRVLEVDPGPGTELPLPGHVQVTVSLGPPRVTMPDLLGMTQDEALDSLDVLGLSVAAVDTVFRFGRDQGLVVEQAPPADSLLERGAAVRISVGRTGGG